jgi:plasmid stabilization system protein ParE
LREVYDYIARDSRRYARATVERLRRAARRVARFPEYGEVIAELEGGRYRQIVVASYRLIYRHNVAERRATVHAVVHASRDLPRALKGR